MNDAESEKDALVGTQAPPARRRAVVRGIGIALLSVPVLLVLVCTGAIIYNSVGPSDMGRGSLLPHEYLTMYPTTKRPKPARLLSNGTHEYEPTVILVSLDGFRPDYMERGLTPNLRRIGRTGLRADYMIPSFPSSTFPNHYTLVTGLYPGSHGIVGNVFYDTEVNDTFVYKDDKRNRASHWWDAGEPVWVTAEKQGRRAGIDMWPGSTAVIRGSSPSYLIPYADNVHPLEKTQQLAEWLDMPLDRRPSFLATYMPEVDQMAHRLGPDAHEVDEAVQMVDEALGDLWAQLERRNLTHVVNLVVVSDHGMAASRAHQDAIYIDDLIDVSKLIGIYNWPLAGLQPKNMADVPELYQALRAASPGQPWEVYLREDIPDRFHFRHPTRVAPIYVVPEPPYYMTTRAADEYHSKDILVAGSNSSVVGVHGYDNRHPLMRATFVATGPAFRQRSSLVAAANATEADDGVVRIQQGPAVSTERIDENTDRVSDMDVEQVFADLVHDARADYRAEYDELWGDAGLGAEALRKIRHPPFENVELYGLLTRILGLDPAPNNGTDGFYRWWLQ